MTRFEIARDSDGEVYAEWHRPLLDRLFGDTIKLHYDLYEMTHVHRGEHNGGRDDGPCTAWPSPPYRAPVWSIVAEKIGARRFLEIGTALGYTAALMAEAGGPRCKVDTIEIDPGHADLAEGLLDKKGLLKRVRVLRGDEETILRALSDPYDVVFADGGKSDTSTELQRLSRPGGVSREFKGRVGMPLVSVLTGLRESLELGDLPEAVALSEARDSYRRAVWEAMDASTGS